MRNLSQQNKAILWMLGAMGSLLSVSIFAKVLSANYSTFEIMFYRSIIGFFAFVLFLMLRGEFKTLRIRNTGLHFTRNIIHFTAQNLWFYALAMLPLATVISFEFTTPAWVIIFAAILLGEGFGWRRFIVIILSLIGVLMITGIGQTEANFALVAAITCAIAFALNIIVTKTLTRHQSVNEILLMMTLMQGIFAALIVIYTGKLAPLLWEALPWLVLIGIMGTASHYCMTNALKLADAAIIAPIDLVRLPISIIIGWALFGETITMMTIAGSGVLILANYINLKRKKRITT